VTVLVSGHLWIYLKIMAQTLKLACVPLKIWKFTIPDPPAPASSGCSAAGNYHGPRRCPVGWKNQRFITYVQAERTPFFDVDAEIGRNRRFSSAPVSLWGAAAAAVYPLNNQCDVALDPSPP
jgi:hypothetical protein